MSVPLFKLKKLVSILSDLDGFNNPKPKLEQYSSSADVAASILYDIQSRDDAIHNKSVVDLGCGPGIFTIGSILLGASFVLSIDVDEDVLNILKTNLSDMELNDSPMDIIQADVYDLDVGPTSKLHKAFDTVITNPPFGTAHTQRGADIVFLTAALQMSRRHVYSMHKTTTREFVLKKAQSCGANSATVAELKFDIPACRSRHTKKSLDVCVDLVHSWFDEA